MELYYSDLCLLGGNLEANITKLSALGAKNIELMMDGGEWDGFLQNRNRLLDILRSHPVRYSLHSPCWDNNLTSENDRIRAASLQSTLDALECASELGCVHLVVHPGFCQEPVFDRERAARRSREALELLAGRAKARGVRLAVENVGYHGTSLFSMEEFIHLLDGMGEEAGYLIDTGHAALNGWNLPELVRRLSARLLGIHLHDNDGRKDAHLPIGEGVVDWEPLLRQIAGSCPCCSLILEYNFGTSLSALPRSAQYLQTFFAEEQAAQ